MNILGTNHVCKNRHEALEIRCDKKYIKHRQDYSKRLVQEFIIEIQSQYFGGDSSLSIEDIALEYYKKYDDRFFFTENTVDELIGDFCSYLSDDSNKYA